MTTESALVWTDTGQDRHDAFVAMSRARGTTRLFVDRAGLDAQVRTERALTDRTRAIEPPERRAALARLLSRSSEKASTLDLIGAAIPASAPLEAMSMVTIPNPSPKDPLAPPPIPPNRTRTRRRRPQLGLGS